MGAPPDPSRRAGEHADTPRRARASPPPLLGAVEADPDETVADVELEEVLDRPADVPDGLPGQLDPEAGRTSVASRARAAREAVRTPFGRLIVAMPVGLAGLALAIMAATHRTWPLIGATAVVAPVGAVLVYVRYQQWLGHKRYMYRLLETLGEDVSDFDVQRRYRPPKVRRR